MNIEKVKLKFCTTILQTKNKQVDLFIIGMKNVNVRKGHKHSKETEASQSLLSDTLLTSR